MQGYRQQWSMNLRKRSSLGSPSSNAFQEKHAFAGRGYLIMPNGVAQALFSEILAKQTP